MAKSAEMGVRNLGSLGSLGCLLLVAGSLSLGIYRLNGEWPVGLDGIGAGIFIGIGVVFVGISLVIQVRARRAASE